MGSRMTKTLAFLAAIVLAFSAFIPNAIAGQAASPPPAAVQSASNVQRVGDLTRVKHEDRNFVQQIGLVVGLSGSGDTQTPDAGTRLHKLISRYRSAGVLTVKDLRSKNIAAVMVKATILPNMKEGDPIDITVAATDSSKSLKGGMLLLTFLEGPAQRIRGTYPKDAPRIQYVQAQGQIEIEGGNENVGVIRQGGSVLQEIKSTIYDPKTRSISLVLNHADHVMAAQVVKAINGAREQLLLGGEPPSTILASALDSKEIMVKVPTWYASANRLNEFIARVKKINVTIEEPTGKILINKRINGIWITGYVTISEAAFSYKDVAIRIQPVQGPGPPPLKQKTIFTLPKNVGSVELNTLVDTLNALEVKTEDIIAIIEGLHKARAIKAKLEYVEG